MTTHSVIDAVRTVGSVIGLASFAANFLPAASTYDDYPRFKRFYETFIVNTVAAVSLSIRAQYPSLAIPMFGLKQPPTPIALVSPTANGIFSPNEARRHDSS